MYSISYTDRVQALGDLEKKKVSTMAVHGQEQLKADSIARFGKIQLTSFDEHALVDLLAKLWSSLSWITSALFKL